MHGLHHLLSKATVKIITGEAAAKELYEVTDVRIGLAHSGSFDLDTRGPTDEKTSGIYTHDDIKDKVLLESPKTISTTDDDSNDALIGSTLVIPNNTNLGISITYQYKDMPKSSVTKPFSITDEFTQDKHIIYLFKLSVGNAIEFTASVTGFDSPIDKQL